MLFLANALFRIAKPNEPEYTPCASRSLSCCFIEKVTFHHAISQHVPHADEDQSNIRIWCRNNLHHRQASIVHNPETRLGLRHDR
jgi:hypothetical protein